MTEVLYNCDGKREQCNISPLCFRNGGECRCTTDIKYTKNVQDIQNKQEENLDVWALLSYSVVGKCENIVGIFSSEENAKRAKQQIMTLRAEKRDMIHIPMWLGEDLHIEKYEMNQLPENWETSFDGFLMSH